MIYLQNDNSVLLQQVGTYRLSVTNTFIHFVQIDLIPSLWLQKVNGGIIDCDDPKLSGLQTQQPNLQKLAKVRQSVLTVISSFVL